MTLLQMKSLARAERERESIRLQVWKLIRNAKGDLPTDAEVEEAIRLELERRKPKPVQLNFLDTGANAAESRNESAARRECGATARRVAALEAFEAAGMRGCTRYELAERLGVQQSSICATVLKLLASNQIVELRKKRCSAVGGEGCVLVLTRFADEGRQSA
jgi:hypothetical protein